MNPSQPWIRGTVIECVEKYGRKWVPAEALWAAIERTTELEELLREAYEEDHRGSNGPVGELGERIHTALNP